MKVSVLFRKSVDRGNKSDRFGEELLSRSGVHQELLRVWFLEGSWSLVLSAPLGGEKLLSSDECSHTDGFTGGEGGCCVSFVSSFAFHVTLSIRYISILHLNFFFKGPALFFSPRLLCLYSSCFFAPSALFCQFFPPESRVREREREGKKEGRKRKYSCENFLDSHQLVSEV